MVLSQADFAMSKIAANESYGGSTMRKGIDYFCHLAISPDFYNKIVDIDSSFTRTAYFQKMAWLRHETDDLYDPSYTDMLRVAFTSEFSRGKLSDLVSLLSGRNFLTRTYEEEIAEQSFKLLEKGILNFMNETNFKRFIMIIKSAGFIVPTLIRSQNALNFAYIVYLRLKSLGYDPALIEKYVRKWFVLTMLTGRYSGSAESFFDFDIRNISTGRFEDYLALLESSHLGDSFWEVSLVQSLNTSVASSPFFNVFLAAQVKANDKGFLSRDITVTDLIVHKGDIHHIFPSEYLKKLGLQRGQYNQIANYVFMQSEINIRIGNKAPNIYFNTLLQQCETKIMHYGGIDKMEELKCNLKSNCIPESVFNYTIENYDQFLLERRKLMASKMKAYYHSL